MIVTPSDCKMRCVISRRSLPTLKTDLDVRERKNLSKEPPRDSTMLPHLCWTFSKRRKECSCNVLKIRFQESEMHWRCLSLNTRHSRVISNLMNETFNK